MKLFKLTNEQGQTQARMEWGEGTQWGPGVSHHVPMVPAPRLRSTDLLHAYTDPDLALLLNPIHRGFSPPRLWAARGVVVCSSWDEVGCYSLTTTRELALPDWYRSRRREVVVDFARLCAAVALLRLALARLLGSPPMLPSSPPVLCPLPIPPTLRWPLGLLCWLPAGRLRLLGLL